METGVNSFSRFKEAFRLKEADASQYSPLVLAYIGDAVYEIMIRTKVVNDGNVQVNKLHLGCVGGTDRRGKDGLPPGEERQIRLHG